MLLWFVFSIRLKFGAKWKVFVKGSVFSSNDRLDFLLFVSLEIAGGFCDIVSKICKLASVGGSEESRESLVGREKKVPM